MLQVVIYGSPVGPLQICENDGMITGLGPAPEEMNDTGYTVGGRHSELLQDACRQLDEYFAGRRRQFDLPLKCEGTQFQRTVWAELCRIPYGETRSYEDIAVNVGNKKAARAVGQADHNNPIMIIVPCHRVIHKNGDITGFACKIEVKRYLLELEKDNM